MTWRANKGAMAARGAVIGLCLAFLAILWAELLIELERQESQAIEAERRNNENLVLILASEVSRVLRNIDAALFEMAWEFDRLGGQLDLANYAAQRLAIQDSNNVMRITDRDGRVVVSSAPQIGQSDFSDYAFHLHHVAGTSPEMFISPPVPGVVVGRWNIYLSRRINLPDGGFAGVVSYGIEASDLGGSINSLVLGKDSRVALTGLDGIVRLRNTSSSSESGRFVGDGWMLRNEVPRAPFGTYVRASATDGIVRITSYRKLDYYPLVVSLGSAETEVLANVRAQRTSRIVLGLLATIFVAAFGAVTISLLIRRDDANRALGESQERYALAEKAVNDCIWDWDMKGDKVYLSPQWQNVLGIGVAESRRASTSGFFGLIHPDDQETMRVLGARHLRFGTPYKSELRIRHRNGSYFWAEIRGQALRDETGRAVRFIGSFSDITERKASEQLLAQTVADLQAAKEAAEIANRTKSAFLANMSHELRTPLNAIIGFSEIMTNKLVGPLSEIYASYAKDVLTSGRHLLSVINDILDMSKIEAGRIELDHRPLDLANVIRSALVIAGGLARDKGLKIETNLAEDTPRIVGDERALKQVVLNLISNAVKFNRPGGEVRISLAVLADGQQEVRIADTGTGISPEQLPTLFQPFRQVGDPMVRRQEGTGLGLWISRQFVTMQGGTLELQSEWGQGTTAIFRLPGRSLPSGAEDRGVQEEGPGGKMPG